MGAITSRGRAGLWFLPRNTTMNATSYLEVLKEKVPVWMDLLGASTFQQDGAPCHTAKKVRDWFNTQSFDLLHPWPGSSPDLNIIENVWAHMKRKVSALHPTSFDSLCEAIKEVWVEEVSVEYCQKLYKSIPKRIHAVLQAKGGSTRY